MKLKDGNILEPKDIACIEHTIASKKLGSQQAAALIEAAGDLSMEGITFEEMIKGLTSNPTRDVRARRIELKRKQTEHTERKKLVAEYQNIIDSFLERLESIDAVYSTYVKINYSDVRIRPPQVHGEPTHPTGYNREIEIDEIILSSTM